MLTNVKQVFQMIRLRDVINKLAPTGCHLDIKPTPDGFILLGLGEDTKPKNGFETVKELGRFSITLKINKRLMGRIGVPMAVHNIDGTNAWGLFVLEGNKDDTVEFKPWERMPYGSLKQIVREIRKIEKEVTEINMEEIKTATIH